MGVNDDLYDRITPLVRNFKRNFTFKLDNRSMENKPVNTNVEEAVYKTIIYYHNW